MNLLDGVIRLKPAIPAVGHQYIEAQLQRGRFWKPETAPPTAPKTERFRYLLPPHINGEDAKSGSMATGI